MPIFLDRHDVGAASADDVAQLHLRDLAIQDHYGVKFITYGYDADRGTTFCLIDAPDRATAERVHSEAHGHIANEMIEVDLSAVEAFLGRIQDPPSAAAKAIDDTAYRAIMFTDIAGSTEMTLRLGDALAVEAVRAHDSIVRRCLTRHGGSEVKHLGDGIMASFGQTCAAVGCAHAIQKTLASYNAESAHPIALRIGIHAGEPVEESRDLFGSAVQMASRICDAARPGAVLVSGDVKDACEGAGLCFEAIGAQPLKGFAEPVPLFCSMAS